MPVTALYSELLLFLAQAHTSLQTVVDTRSVSDDERRSVISLCLFDSIEVLNRTCAHSNLSYIYIAIAHSHHSEILLANFLTACGKFGDSTCRC